jgi:hypothetical protein
MRLATTLVFLVLAAALIGGCGGSGDSTTDHVQGVDEMPEVPTSKSAMFRTEWEATPDCRHPHGASRWGCSVGPYRCQAVVTGRGWSVDCAKPGRSIAFTVPARK